MNDNEWKRVEDAVSWIGSTDEQVQNFTGANGSRVADELGALAKKETDAAKKKHIESVVVPAFKNVQSAAKDEQALMRKFEVDSKKDKTACADAKAFHDKYAKLASSFEVLHNYSTAYVLHLVSDADAAKFRTAKSLKGVTDKAVRYPGVQQTQVKLTVITTESYDAAYQEFVRVWDALTKPPARPATAAPATPPKKA
jgi:hypothetical protein